MFRLPSYLFLTSFYLVLIAIHNLKDKNKYSPWTDHISNFLLILANFVLILKNYGGRGKGGQWLLWWPYYYRFWREV